MVCRPGKAFPDRLEAALRAKGWDVKVINAGVSGDTAADGLARYDWSVPQDADALIIELGANDMLRGMKPDATKTTLAAILEKARAAHLPVLLAGMRAAPNLGGEYAGRVLRHLFVFGEKYDVPLYPFFLEGVAGDPKLNQPDGLHPNAEGVEIIVQKILPSVEALLKASEPVARATALRVIIRSPGVEHAPHSHPFMRQPAGDRRESLGRAVRRRVQYP